MKRLLIALLLFPATLWAEGDFTKRYAPLLIQCYAAAGDGAAKAECINIVSGNCMAYEDGGQTTSGMSRCLSAETAAWDVILKDEYQQTKVWLRSLDDDEAEVFPEFSKRAEALRVAQLAWLVFRDAECDLAYAMPGAGSLRHLTGTGCFMRMTAQRTIKLHEMREY